MELAARQLGRVGEGGKRVAAAGLVDVDGSGAADSVVLGQGFPCRGGGGGRGRGAPVGRRILLGVRQ